MAFGGKGFNSFAKKSLLQNRDDNDDDNITKSLIDNEIVSNGSSNSNESIPNKNNSPDSTPEGSKHSLLDHGETPEKADNDEFRRPPSYQEDCSTEPNKKFSEIPESRLPYSPAKKIGGWERIKQIQQAEPLPEPTENKSKDDQPPKESPWKRLREANASLDTNTPSSPPAAPKESPWKRLKQAQLNSNGSTAAVPPIETTPKTAAPKVSGWGRIKQQQAQQGTQTNDNNNIINKTTQLNGKLLTPPSPDTGKKDLASAAYAVHATQKVTGAFKEKAAARIKMNQKLALKERMRKLVQERLTVRQIFRRYVDSSTLHGFCYVASDTFMIRRIIWALLMIAGAIYFLIKLRHGVIRFQSYPFTTKANTRFVDRLDFPAISFCPINHFKADNYQGTIVEKINQNNGFPISANWTDPGFDVPGENVEDSILENSFTIEEILHECDWIRSDTDNPSVAHRDCGPHNFTRFFSEQSEVCYTVNSGKNNTEIMHVAQAGLRFAYELLFDMRSNDAIITHPYNGMRVIIHDQAEPPVSKNGFILPTGAKSFVSMNRIETHSLPPPFSTDCGEKKLKYYETYNQEACLLELLTNYVGEKCGCRLSYMPSKLPICSLRTEITCVYPAKEKFNAFEMRDNCPINCIETTFKIEVTDQRYLHAPPRGIEPIILRKNLENKELNNSRVLDLYGSMNTTEFGNHVQDSIVSVIFYYPEMKEFINIQSGTFSFYKFLGDAGGEFGLMLGASLLTFFEFIDLIIFLLYHQALRLNKTTGKDENEENDENYDGKIKNGDANGIIEQNNPNTKKDKKKKKKKKKNKKGEGEDENELSTFISECDIST